VPLWFPLSDWIIIRFQCSIGTRSSRLLLAIWYVTIEVIDALAILKREQGEKLPIDLWRINHWLEDIHKPRGITHMVSKTKFKLGNSTEFNLPTVQKRTIREYFATNIWVTTSGNFSTNVLNYVISEIGADRIMFSAD
jgi:2,3-dihydroxybenzoate decarboxylase